MWDSKQRAIINQPADARLLVDAGPGTGKTAVACGRVARLIDCEGLSPSRIWVISFTRVAVQEIQDRIRSYLDHADGCNGVVIATLDSHTWRIHSGYDGSIRLGSYEENISGMLRMIRENEDVQEYLTSVEHLIVDEAQDTVGVRADLLMEIFRRLDPSSGITVFADEAQAIFGWAHRGRNGGASGPVTNLAERIRGGEYPGFTVRRLHTIHRTRSPGLAKILSGVRKQVMAPATDPGARFNTVRAEIIQNAHGRYPVLPLGPDSRAERDCFILHRKNIDAVITSENLGTTPHRMRLGWRYAGYIQPWLGALLGQCPNPKLSREEFDGLWLEAMAGASMNAPAPDEAWEMLLRHGLDVDGRRVDLFRLRGRLADQSPPLEFCRRDIGPAGPMVSTVHASKGREADLVYLNLTPGHWTWNKNIDEETRVLFVGASRARKRLHVIEGGGTAEAAWTARGRIYTSMGGEGWVRVLLRPDSDITPEGVAGTRYFHDASAVKLSQKHLAELTDQITACRAWLDNESGEFYRLVPSTVFPEGSNLKENTLTVLGSPVLMADLHEIKKKVTGRDALVPDYIDQMRMMGVQTIVLPPDSPGLTAIHEPWSTSGFMLAPLLFGYPELQFVSVDRGRRRRETDARFDYPLLDFGPDRPASGHHGHDCENRYY